MLKLWLSLLAMIVLLVATVTATAQAQRKASRPTASHSAKTATRFDELARQANEASQNDKNDEAISLYRQALQIRPTWIEGWWKLGTLFYELDRYSEGRDALRKLVALDPQNGFALALLGLCEFQTKEYQIALNHLTRGRSLGLEANEHLALVSKYHQAILLSKYGQFEMAYALLAETIKKQQESPAVIEAVGMAALRLPLLPDELAAGQHDLVTKAGHAVYFAETERRQEAKQKFEEVVRSYPDAPGVHYAYGAFLMRDSVEPALEEFRRELQVAPKNVAAMLQIAFEAIKQNRSQDGLTYAEQAVRLEPGMPAAHNALGRILLLIGQFDRAIKELELSVKLAPDSPEMYFALARAYDRVGRKADAARARTEFGRLDRLRSAKDQTQNKTAAPTEGKKQ